jgi:hypothetical protein
VWSTIGADATVSGATLAVASSAVSVACDGAEKHTNKAVASINAERPLALIFIFGDLPIPLVPKNRNEPDGVSVAGQKKGNLWAAGGKNWAVA